ncbi:MAG TPA: ATP phosphoribosyltransferase regulatory subunit, partial [Clostridia bacterium]|nr:ATP phosphoribosyltransferase regulatory subunit [Clostridia bacterium]
MSEYIYKTPEGFNDILSEKCSSRLEVEGHIRYVFKGFGYSEVDTPTLEYYDLFSGRIGTLPQERMYKLFDSKGRILVLRPVMTVPIMRMAVTKIGDSALPARFSYFGNIFRNDTKNLLSSEYRQGGIEILGADTIAADAEVIAVAIKSLINSGVADFRIDIGQVKLFKAMTSGIEDEDILEAIRQAVANKDKYTIEKLLENTFSGFQPVLKALLPHQPLHRLQ